MTSERDGRKKSDRRLSRTCASADVREVVDIVEFARQRWPRDGAMKFDVMMRALDDDVRSGVPVVDVWRRFELPGRIAQRLVGLPGYKALFEVLDSNNTTPGFLPRDIAQWVWSGKLSPEEGMQILGIETELELEELIALWLAGD